MGLLSERMSEPAEFGLALIVGSCCVIFFFGLIAGMTELLSEDSNMKKLHFEVDVNFDPADNVFRYICPQCEEEIDIDDGIAFMPEGGCCLVCADTIRNVEEDDDDES